MWTCVCRLWYRVEMSFHFGMFQRERICIRFYALFLLLVFSSPYQHSLITKTFIRLKCYPSQRPWLKLGFNRTIELTCQMISNIWTMFILVHLFFEYHCHKVITLLNTELFSWQGCCPFTRNGCKWPTFLEMNVFNISSREAKSEIL